MMRSVPHNHISFRTFTAVLTSLTLFLIFLGGLVKSHEAGLSVPDWPTSFGYNMFLFPPSLWVGGIYYEHTHRLVASFLGGVTLLFALYVGFAESRRWVKKLAFLGLLMVCVQGVLGGMTVRYSLPAAISIFHGVLAQVFFLWTLFMLFVYSGEGSFERKFASKTTRLKKGAWVFVSVLFAQLFLGALMRHTESGLAIPDFPTMGGALFPTFSESWLAGINATLVSKGLPEVASYQAFFHFLHRLGGVVVVTALVKLFIAYRKKENTVHSPLLFKNLFQMAVVCGIQILLGVFTILSVKGPLITSLHVVTGAFLLGLSFLFAIRLEYSGTERGESTPLKKTSFEKGGSSHATVDETLSHTR